MAQSIYKLFVGKMTEIAYQVSPEEEAKMLAKVDEALEKVGGKRIISCDARWCGDQWTFFGVEEFPNIEAVQQHAKLLGELKWFQYIDTISVLGMCS